MSSILKSSPTALPSPLDKSPFQVVEDVGSIDEQWRKAAVPKGKDRKFVSDIPASRTRRVLVIYTGGTIGMKQTTVGYAPADAGYIHAVLTSLPPFHDLAYGDPRETYLADPTSAPDFVMPPSKFQKTVVYNVLEYEPLLDSCNMDHNDWQRIANDIHDHYDSYDGFVVLHGTDTMAYTGSALSFYLENLSKTVVITGSQIPLSIPLSDGISNLLGALTVASHFEIPEVTIGVDYTVKWNLLVPPPMGKLKVHNGFEQNIAVFRLFPGVSVQNLANLLQPPLRGLILSTFGAGNAPDTNVELVQVLTKACDRGVVIVNCSQCWRGTVETHYATGQVLQRAGIVSGYDMLVEAALAKLGYLLSVKGLNVDQVRRAMVRNLRGELTPARKQRFSYRSDQLKPQQRPLKEHQKPLNPSVRPHLFSLTTRMNEINVTSPSSASPRRPPPRNSLSDFAKLRIEATSIASSAGSSPTSSTDNSPSSTSSTAVDGTASPRAIPLGSKQDIARKLEFAEKLNTALRTVHSQPLQPRKQQLQSPLSLAPAKEDLEKKVLTSRAVLLGAHRAEMGRLLLAVVASSALTALIVIKLQKQSQ